jgi:hypothetical protein
MPTKRQRVTRSLVARITPEAIAAWKAGEWGDLQRALRLPPWHASPFDADGDCPTGNTAGAATWPEAVQLRAQLYALAGDPGRDTSPTNSGTTPEWSSVTPTPICRAQ